MTTRITAEEAANRPAIPEQAEAIKLAKQLLKGNLRIARVLKNKDGETTRTDKHPSKFDIVFIRKDGWALACRKSLRESAEDTWGDSWVGRLEIDKPNKIFMALYVISDQGFEYKWGVLNFQGEQVSISNEPPQEVEPQPGNVKGRSLEEMQEWMSDGCPIEE